MNRASHVRPNAKQSLKPDQGRSAPSLDFLRIIVEFGDGFVTSKASEELAQKIWQDLRDNIKVIGATIAGVEFTLAKNLALTITPPRLASHFLQHEIQVKLRFYLIAALEAHQNAVIWIYPDQSWPRVIVHQVPLIPTFFRQEDALATIMWNLAAYNPVIQETPAYILAKARFLKPFNSTTIAGGRASIYIPLQSTADAERFKENGAFIYGRRHQVSLEGARDSRRR